MYSVEFPSACLYSDAIAAAAASTALFVPVRPLGVGTFGSVWEAAFQLNDGAPAAVLEAREDRCCVKQIRLDFLAATRSYQGLIREARALRLLQHVHLRAPVPLPDARVCMPSLRHNRLHAAPGTSVDDTYVYLCMTLATGCPLDALIRVCSKRGHAVPARVVSTVATCLLHALHHMHASGIAHRDLHSGNVVLHTPRDSSVTAMIVDLGLCRGIRATPCACAARIPCQGGDRHAAVDDAWVALCHGDGGSDATHPFPLAFMPMQRLLTQSGMQRGSDTAAAAVTARVAPALCPDDCTVSIAEGYTCPAVQRHEHACSHGAAATVPSGQACNCIDLAAADMYSFACVLHELCTGSTPLPHCATECVCDAAAHAELRPILRAMRACLSAKPNERPTAHDLVCVAGAPAATLMLPVDDELALLFRAATEDAAAALIAVGIPPHADRFGPATDMNAVEQQALVAELASEADEHVMQCTLAALQEVFPHIGVPPPLSEA